MLSFGIEYDLAFSIAFCNARLAAGSGPPSRAATMIARESLEKSFPRRASAAPFLCLIDDDLLCPDIRLLSVEVQETLVDAGVVCQLRVEGGDDEASLPHQDGLACVLREHLDVRSHVAHPEGAHEHAPERRVLAGHAP